MLLPKRLLCRGFRRGYHQQALGKLFIAYIDPFHLCDILVRALEVER